MRKIYLFLTVFCAVIFSVPVFSQINSGSPAIEFGSNTDYDYGIMPTNLPTSGTYGESQAAADAYEYWKDNLTETCTNGIRVKYDTESQTVSEGIAYGMLLAAYAGDKDLFDGLWEYYLANTNSNGVMNWKIGGCSGTVGSNGATDAELDAAMALIIASKQWPSSTDPYTYEDEALDLIGAIRQYEIDNSSYQTLNGDGWGTSNTCRNPSYFAPAYYREFAKLETNYTTFWGNVADASEDFLLTNRNSTTGLVCNWANSSGTSNDCNSTSQLGISNEYGFDACRNPWRMATDVLWNGTSTADAAYDICGKLSEWLSGSESSLKGPLAQDEDDIAQGTYKNGAFSTFALAPMVSSDYQSSLNSCYTNVASLGDDSYFNQTIKTITLFMLTGNFWSPSTSTEATAPVFSSATTNGDASIITVTFTKALETPATSDYSAFTLSINGTAVSDAFTAIAINGTKAINLTVSSSVTIAEGDVLTLAYTPGSIESTEEVALEAFSGETVTNVVGTATIIANCEDGSQTKLFTEWYSYNDATDGGTSTVTPLTDTETIFTMTAGGANDTDSAAMIDFTLYGEDSLGYKPFVGLGFTMNSDESAYDLDGSTGISFYHKGSEATIQVALATNENSNYYSASIDTHTEWTLVTVEWSALAQGDWGDDTKAVDWDASQIFKFQWQVQDADNTTGELWIDEVQIDGIALTLPTSADDVNKTTLAETIDEAEDLVDNATVGDDEGEYTQDVVDALSSAITSAQAVYDDDDATQAEVNAANSALSDAIDTFEASVNVAEDPATLIADCDGLEPGSHTYMDTYWYSYADGESSIDPLTSDTQSFTMTADGANGTDSSAYVTGSLENPGADDYESAGIGFWMNDDETAYDLSEGTGISFWHKGDEVYFTVAISSITQDKGYDHYFLVEEHSDWTLVEVEFDDLIQPGWMSTSTDASVTANVMDFDAGKVLKLQWQIKDSPARDYDYGIDEVTVMGVNLDLPDLGGTTTVDKTDLAADISTAYNLDDNATIGDDEGEYTQTVVDALSSAITTAQAVYDDDDATQAEVDDAEDALEAAIATFEASVNTATEASTLIADCDGLEPGSHTYMDTYWYSYADGESSIDPLTSDTQSFTMTADGANGTDSSAYVTGSLENPGADDYESAGIGFWMNDDETAYDLSEGTGISFWHKGDEVYFTVAISSITQDKGYDHYFLVEEHSDWTLVEVEFDDLIQPGWMSTSTDASVTANVMDFDAGKVLKLQWQIKDSPARDYDYGIDEVTVMGVNLDLPDLGGTTTVDKTDLAADISTAEDLVDNATVGDDEGEYTQTVVDALSSAITTAQAVYDDDDATQAEVDDAEDALEAAIATFEASVNTATVTTTIIASNELSTTELLTYWYSYNDSNDDGSSTITPTGSFTSTAGGAEETDSCAKVTYSLDQGSNTNSPYVGFGFSTMVDESESFDFSTTDSISFYHKGDICYLEISLPENVGTSPNYDTYHVEVEAHTTWTKVTYAWSDFEQYGWGDSYDFDASQIYKFQWKITGSTDDAGTVSIDQVAVIGESITLPGGTTTVDKTDLAADISTANGLVTNATVGDDEGEYTQTVVDALSSAITTAQAVYDDADATQTEVDDAEDALETAIATFEANVNGSSEIDVSELTAEISKATSTLSAATIGSENGNYPQSAADALQSAIETAEAIEDSPESETQVSQAVSDLADAIAAFEAAVIVIDDISELTISLNVYPNPVSDVLTVEVEGLQQVIITSITGQIAVTSTKATIDVSDLAEGVYTVSVITSTGTASTVIVK